MKQLTQKQIETRLRHIHKTIECGLDHSGIKACCVKFYVTVWMWMNNEARQSYWKIIGNRHGYVPCPTCVTKKSFIGEVKRCPEESNCNHFNEFVGDYEQ